jgi:hypothetical protein
LNFVPSQYELTGAGVLKGATSKTVNANFQQCVRAISEMRASVNAPVLS